MKKYEAVFVFAPDMDEETRNGVVERFKGIIEADGSIDKIDEWGMRKLAFEINDYTEGYYTLINFESGADVINELNRIAKITDTVIRHMIIREEE
ncbi:30S ribosomal protein S6 [Brassicibacter mesophilus]|uniref:30S ribosomal protein S6 n=1 Tax=Brassicibacter mesophilus TaxID=745119 RepID=UPI003D21EF9C